MNEDFFATLDILRPVAKKQGLAEAERALRWMTHHSMLRRGFGDAVIIGASSMKHLEESLVDLEKGPLPEEVVRVINAGWEKQARYLEGIGIE
jgi:aflatoxin B1 aldehyde reductase